MTLSQINPNQLRPPDDDSSGPIVKIGPDRRPEAIERLVGQGASGDRDHARRFLDYARDHQIDLDGLWSRLDWQGRIRATVLTIASPGRTAMVFASRVSSPDQLASVAGVIARACESLVERHVTLAQVLLDPGESADREAFLQAGFIDLATLNYLERPIPATRSPRHEPTWPPNAWVVPYQSDLRTSLLEVLQATYEDTLDCPGLRGRRRVEDIFEGHRAAGFFDPALWHILLLDDAPAGIALLNPSADRRSIELVYLGLIKSARRRGIGKQLLRHALHSLVGRNERTIHLAVDECNGPAISLYKREGFRMVQRRRAMIRPIESAT